MAFGTLVKDQVGIPIAQGYIPGVGFVGAQSSSLKNTDGSTNVSAPMVTANQIQANLLLGNAFIATTGVLATATNGNLTMGMSVFNSSTAKNMYITSIKWSAQEATNASPHLQLKLTTSNPAFANSITPENLSAGGSASVATVTSAVNSATASVSVSGTNTDVIMAGAEGTYEFLLSDTGILLPSGAANGIAVYGLVVTAAKNWSATVRWVEF